MIKQVCVKVKGKSQKEVHIFLDMLIQAKYYGEVTLYFQDGNIEQIKQLFRISKKQLTKRLQNIREEDIQQTNIYSCNKTRASSLLQLTFPFLIINSEIEGKTKC